MSTKKDTTSRVKKRQPNLAEGAVPASELSTKQDTTSRVKKRQTYLAEGAFPVSEHQAGHHQEVKDDINLPGRRSCPCQ